MTALVASSAAAVAMASHKASIISNVQPFSRFGMFIVSVVTPFFVFVRTRFMVRDPKGARRGR
jgi:hypothetical protein